MKIQNKKILSTVLLGAAVVGAIIVSIAKASADVMVTYTVNVTGMPQMPARPGFTPPKFPVTIKAFYSGTKARIEAVGGQVTIYDTAAQQTYHINPATKTYFIQPTGGPGGFGGRHGGPGGGGPGRGGPGGDGGFGGRGGGANVTLQQTGDTKPILSIAATRYALAGSFSFGGGRRGGGTGQDNGGGPPPGFTPPALSVDGNVWFSSSLPLPRGATSADPEASVVGLGMRMLTRPIAADVLKIGQIPIAGKVHMSMTRPDFNGGAPITMNIVETFAATSISRHPLQAYLFTPPSSYTKVDAPQRGGFGGGGGFGGRRGGGGGQDNGGGAPPPDDNGGGAPPPPPDNGGN